MQERRYEGLSLHWSAAPYTIAMGLCIVSCKLLCLTGASNLISGALGAGFTGSYIFSQTIFSMRANVKTKLHGFIVVGKAPFPV